MRHDNTRNIMMMQLCSRRTVLTRSFSKQWVACQMRRRDNMTQRAYVTQDPGTELIRRRLHTRCAPVPRCWAHCAGPARVHCYASLQHSRGPAAADSAVQASARGPAAPAARARRPAAASPHRVGYCVAAVGAVQALSQCQWDSCLARRGADGPPQARAGWRPARRSIATTSCHGAGQHNHATSCHGAVQLIDRFGRMLGSFPPAVANRLLLIKFSYHSARVTRGAPAALRVRGAHTETRKGLDATTRCSNACQWCERGCWRWGADSNANAC